jgi:hypothetical protein
MFGWPSFLLIGGLPGYGLLGLFKVGCSGDQFDRNHLGPVADAPARLNDARVSAGTIPKPRRDIAEQFRDYLFASEKAEGTSSGGQRSFLPQRDHPLGEASHLLGLGLRGLDPFLIKQRRHQTPKQSPPMLGLPAELSPLFPVAHGKSSYL